jgi:type 1 glutamine amidotransferase
MAPSEQQRLTSLMRRCWPPLAEREGYVRSAVFFEGGPMRLYFSLISLLLVPCLAAAGEPKPLVVDPFDGNGPKLGRGWETYVDANNLGSKANAFEFVKEGSPPKHQGHGHFSGHVGKSKAPFPWISLDLEFHEDGPKDVTAFNSIRFQAKGDGKKHRIRIGREANPDHCYYEYIFTAPKEWTEIIAPFKDFVQPKWGKQIAREFKDVTKVGFLALAPGDDEDFTLRISGLEFAVASPAAIAQTKTRILFIGKDPDHPYGSHMYMHTCGVLAKCVELTPGVEAVVSNGWPKDKALLAGVKTVVVYTNPAAEFLLDSPDRDEIESAFKNGVGMTTIHWASTVKKENYDRLGPLWLRYAGGTWISNIGLSDGVSTVKRLEPNHPISRGWKEFELNDEYYLDPVLKGAKPLLQVREKKGKDVVVGWTYERPDGSRAFATTLGHSYKYFQLESFRQMIVNGILWSAKVDVPMTGAPIDVGEQVLTLPPAPLKNK